MKDTIAEMLTSKKFLAFLAGALAAILIKLAGKYQIALDQATADSIADRVVGLAAVYIGGQGLADFGKHAAEIHADAQAMSNAPTPISPIPLPPPVKVGP